MAEIEVCALDDLEEAVPRVVALPRRRIVLVRWEDRVYALKNICPHMSASFARGPVFGRIGGPVGDVEITNSDPVIMCPWHQYEFVLGSGRCITDARLRVRSYAVEVRDRVVYVDVGRARSRPPAMAAK